MSKKSSSDKSPRSTLADYVNYDIFLNSLSLAILALRSLSSLCLTVDALGGGDSPSAAGYSSSCTAGTTLEKRDLVNASLSSSPSLSLSEPGAF
jgi:hypothetical protein